MKKLLILGLVIGLVACAGTLRHKLVVTSASSHAVLAATQDTVKVLTCSPTVSQPCIGPELRKTIAEYLVKGFQLDEDLATAIRNWDGTTPQPAQIAQLVADLSKVITDILALIPTSHQKTVLETKLGVH